MTEPARIILVEKEDMQFLHDLLAAEPEYLPWVHKVPKRLFLEWPEGDDSAVKISLEHHPGFDPTGEGSAYQPEPGSDAQHPPVGYRLAKPGEMLPRDTIVWYRNVGPWMPLEGYYPPIPLLYCIAEWPPMAVPLAANEGDSRLAPEAWNEESRKKILALVEENDMLRKRAIENANDAQDNLVRAVVAEREAARLRTEVDQLKASQVLIPEPSPSAMAGLSAVATTERAVRAALSWARRMVHAIGADEVVVKREEQEWATRIAGVTVKYRGNATDLHIALLGESEMLNVIRASHLRTIGPGEVVVDVAELAGLRERMRKDDERCNRSCSDCQNYNQSQSCPGCSHPQNGQNEYAFDWNLAQRCEFYALRSQKEGGA